MKYCVLHDTVISRARQAVLSLATLSRQTAVANHFGAPVAMLTHTSFMPPENIHVRDFIHVYNVTRFSSHRAHVRSLCRCNSTHLVVNAEHNKVWEPVEDKRRSQRLRPTKRPWRRRRASRTWRKIKRRRKGWTSLCRGSPATSARSCRITSIDVRSLRVGCQPSCLTLLSFVR